MNGYILYQYRHLVLSQIFNGLTNFHALERVKKALNITFYDTILTLRFF